MTFEIKFEDINSINHNEDFWSKRDTQMDSEMQLLDTKKEQIKPIELTKTKKSKKKTKIINKIEKEYEIINGNESNLIENIIDILPDCVIDNSVTEIKKNKKKPKIISKSKD